MDKGSTTYIVGFAAVVCIVCSLGVAGASMGLRPLQEANELAAFQTSILNAVDLPAKDEAGNRPSLDKKETQALFDKRLKLILVDDKGEEVHADLEDPEAKKAKLAELRAAATKKGEDATVHPVYLRVAESGDTVEAYAIELQGNGLWGPLSGYIALEPDGKTVMSVAFDAPKETPGLGAEITKAPFKQQWVGKSIVEGGKLAPIDVSKSCGGDAAHCVDGVSGATITSRGVDAMVERAINVEYANYLKKIQEG